MKSLVLKQRKESTTELRQSDLRTQSLSQHLYLLERSFGRCEYLKEHGAPNIFVDVEMNLFRQRLQSFCTELTK